MRQKNSAPDFQKAVYGNKKYLKNIQESPYVANMNKNGDDIIPDS